MSNPIIKLHSWEYARGFEVGIGRFIANWGRKDAAHYAENGEAMEENRSASVAAALCEIAVARYTNQYWWGHVWPAGQHLIYAKKPDVGRDIEVRRVRTRREVAVRRGDAGKVVWAARVVCPEYRAVEICGSVVANKIIGSMADWQDMTYVPLNELDGFSGDDA